MRPIGSYMEVHEFEGNCHSSRDGRIPVALVAGGYVITRGSGSELGELLGVRLRVGR